MNEQEMEAWLRQALIPVEPPSGFVTRLRARLVEVQGRARVSPWLFVLVIGSLAFLMAAAIGASVRVLLAILAVLGLLGRRPAERRRSSASG
jgi:hypothetical protein